MSRAADGHGEWIEVSALGPERSAREHERALQRLRAECAGLEIHEYLTHKRCGYTAVALVRINERRDSDPLWRAWARDVVLGRAAAGEPPRALQVLARHEGDDDLDGATWLVRALEIAERQTGMNHRERTALLLAAEFAVLLRSACARIEAAAPPPREAAAAVLDAWTLGDRGAGDLWWRWSRGAEQ